MAKKIIAVVGATGAQGGGLAKAILADPDGSFTLRALTRKVDPGNEPALRIPWFYAESTNRVILCTHAFRKRGSTPERELRRAEAIGRRFLDDHKNRRLEFEGI